MPDRRTEARGNHSLARQSASNGRGFHEKACPCQGESDEGGLRGLAPWRSLRQRLMRAFGAPSPPRLTMPLALARSPLSLIPAMSSEWRESVKGAPVLRGLANP
jgi:hypothetical protein